MKNVCKMLSLALVIGLLSGCEFTGSAPAADASSAANSSVVVESNAASDLPKTSSFPEVSSAQVSSEEAKERKTEMLAVLLNALQRPPENRRSSLRIPAEDCRKVLWRFGGSLTFALRRDKPQGFRNKLPKPRRKAEFPSRRFSSPPQPAGSAD